jgi:hypothetical protein
LKVAVPRTTSQATGLPKQFGERLQDVADLKAKGIFEVVAEKVLAAVGALTIVLKPYPVIDPVK